MNDFRAVIILVFVLLISMTENGLIINPAGPPGPFVRPDSYKNVKDGSSNEGDDKLFLD
jgi:hypothetical protein